ncbi:riboflavin kinase [Helicosporidium sp. ATCC 50920]|nr:riboflavin kinase [Helicosporidium sp. ATCC 50920]|eukprot:KDD75876.1 riboflavin kinase [Helicosporidium sp. ATCC 50920]
MYNYISTALAIVRTTLEIAEAQRALARCGPAAPSSLGNDLQLRCWEGSIATLPAYQGPADLIVVVEGIEDVQAQLLAGSLLLKPGGHLLWAVPSSMAGAGFALTDAVHAAGKGLPMRLTALGCHHALFQVPEGYALPSGPLSVRGSVISGHGRGSRQLGFPTANIDPAALPEAFHALALGVYFGWARVDNGAGIHPAVMNVGKSPTFEDADPKLSVETHIMHTFDRDFYGKELHVMILGYLRPELKFSGLDALVARIEKDVGLARTQLASSRWLKCQAHMINER